MSRITLTHKGCVHRACTWIHKYGRNVNVRYTGTTHRYSFEGERERWQSREKIADKPRAHVTHLIWPRSQPRLQPQADRCKMGSKKWHSTTLTVLLNFLSRRRRLSAMPTRWHCGWKWRFNSYIYIRNPQFLVSQEIGNNGRYLVDVGVGGVRALIWWGKYKLVGTARKQSGVFALSNAGYIFPERVSPHNFPDKNSRFPRAWDLL